MADKHKTVVYIVDDDKSVREALSMLILSADMKAKTFERPDDFFNYMDPQEKSCLIMDVEMKGMGGFDFYTELQAKGIDIPTIFLTASDSQENRQQAKQTGAVGYLTKPVDDRRCWTLSSGHLQVLLLKKQKAKSKKD